MTLPHDKANKDILELGITVNTSFMEINNVSNFGVYFEDPYNYKKFLPSSYKISGPRYVKKSDVHYYLKTYVTYDLGTISDCKVYERIKDYGKCIEDEIRARVTKSLGCTPLWFTDTPSSCSPVNISKEASQMVHTTLIDMYNNDYPHLSSCKSPCKSVKYTAIHKNYDLAQDGGQLWIAFDQFAMLSKTQLVVDGFTLFNRIGGIIGFCRNILWLLFLLSGLYKIVEYVKKTMGAYAYNNENSIPCPNQTSAI